MSNQPKRYLVGDVIQPWGASIPLDEMPREELLALLIQTRAMYGKPFRDEWMNKQAYLACCELVKLVDAAIARAKTTEAEHKPPLLQVTIADFLDMVKKEPDMVGIPIYYAVWPKTQ